MQGIEHSQVDKSQHAQLLSTDQATTLPITEEDEGVETSTPPSHLEVTSPNQLKVAPGENVDREVSVGDSDLDLDGRADQYVLLQEKIMLDWTNHLLMVSNHRQRLCQQQAFNQPTLSSTKKTSISLRRLILWTLLTF